MTDNDEPEMCETYDATAKEWRRPSDGKLHRVGAPAVIWFDGTEVYYKDGLLHREDGPAYDDKKGLQQFFLFGNEVTPKEFDKWREQNLSEQERRRAETHQQLMEACEEATTLKNPVNVNPPLKVVKLSP
jgi:hypothetical protein